MPQKCTKSLATFEIKSFELLYVWKSNYRFIRWRIDFLVTFLLLSIFLKGVQVRVI